MVRMIVAGTLLIATLTQAAAQQQAPAPVSLPLELANRIYGFLANGGSYAEATGLREALQQNAQAPQREADIQRRIDAAVADALAKAKAGAASAPQH